VSERAARLGRPAAIAAAALLVAALPLYLEGFWLQTGLFAMAAAIGAIGLTLLVGVTGQLSLGHAFFVAIGAYGYCYLAGGEAVPGLSAPAGLELPPVVAMAGAVALAGLAGLCFSPIAGRVRGIYLGIATIGLVFLGQHVMLNAADVTGGFNGRDAQPFAVAGLSFGDEPVFSVLGVAYGELERLWYLGAVLLLAAAWLARNIVSGRPGRAFETVRDSELAAATMGIDVRRAKAAAFCLSSMYAGLAGALFALAYGRIVPDSFGFVLSIEFLVMIVLGGLGSIGGAIGGAFFVAALPQVLNHYSDQLPFIGEAGSGAVGPTQLSRLLFGAAIVAVLLYAPRGIAGVAGRLPGRRLAHPSPPPPV
jgi:branched-chain amino acid transport system permease protein